MMFHPMIKLIYVNRFPTIGRLLAHWGLGITMGGILDLSWKTTLFGAITCSIGQTIVAIYNIKRYGTPYYSQYRKKNK